MELSLSLVFDPYLPTVSRRKELKLSGLFFFFFWSLPFFSKFTTGQAWRCLCGPWLLCGAEVDMGEGRRRGQEVDCVQGDPAHVGLSLMSWAILFSPLDLHFSVPSSLHDPGSSYEHTPRKSRAAS